MVVVNKTIRILVVILFFGNAFCQDGYADQTNIHMHQMGSNEGQIEAITGYSAIVQNDPNNQLIRPANVQYRMNDDANQQSDYNRAERGRTRKIFRIKNPFQQTIEEDTNKPQNITISSPDTETGASNQYTAIQYSLPPDEFLQQMRAENQYHVQQQEVSTPSPTFGYTATPQPQYQYSTISVSNYNGGNQQNNPMPQSESKIPSQFYNHNLNNYQYNNGYSYGVDGIQSTPSSVTLYLSSTPPSIQYQFQGIPSSNYVSSSSPIYLSSPTNLHPYISSTLSNAQTGTPNYYNNYGHSTAIESNLFNYGTNNRETDPKMIVNHYDNSAIGVQYPVSTQKQYTNEFPSSTPTSISSSSSAYPDAIRNTWQNSVNNGLNGFSNLRQEISLTNQQNVLSNNQETLQDTNQDNQNSDIHQIGSIPSANNLVLSFIQPDYQTLTNLKIHGNDIEQQNKKSDIYSHGDYGWKLDGRKPFMKYDVTTPENNQKHKSNNYQADSNSISISNRFLDNEKTYNFDQASKLNYEKLDAQEFAKAAAKAHNTMKKQQQIYLNSYSSNENYPHTVLPNIGLGNVLFSNNNQKSNLYDNSNLYVNASPDLITASPYYISNSRESIFDNKVKQPYDNLNKNFQSTVKINVPNVSPNTDTRMKYNSGRQTSHELNVTNDSIDFNEQNLKQFLKPMAETYHKEKNVMYDYNYRSNPSEVLSSDLSKRLEPNYENNKQYGPLYNSNNLPYKQQSDRNLSPFNYLDQSNIDNVQTQSNVQQQNIQRLQNQETSDVSNNLKLNDIPYWLTQGLNTGNFRIQNNYDHRLFSTPAPIKLNQNVDSHQLDVAASILKKLMLDKKVEFSSKPEYDPQAATLLPTINGLKVVNPYNLDLKLVLEFLRGNTASNDLNTIFRNQFNKHNPLRWDVLPLNQVISKNDNIGRLGLNEDISGLNSPFFEVRNSEHYPYQGVKYSRSQEDEESLEPITSSSHTHPIGAVVEQDDLANDNKEVSHSDVIGSSDEFSTETEDDKLKSPSIQRIVDGKHRHTKLLPNRHSLQRKIPKMFVEEPYPLLKPPPVHTSRGKSRNIFEIGNRRQRVNKIKLSRIVKREPSFEDESFIDELKPLLQPPPSLVEDNSDNLQSGDNE